MNISAEEWIPNDRINNKNNNNNIDSHINLSSIKSISYNDANKNTINVSMNISAKEWSPNNNINNQNNSNNIDSNINFSSIEPVSYENTNTNNSSQMNISAKEWIPKSPIICRFFNYGACLKGSECLFSHPNDVVICQTSLLATTTTIEDNSIICKYFIQGCCNKGDKCLFKHDNLQVKSNLTPSTTTATTVIHNIIDFNQSNQCNLGDGFKILSISTRNNNNQKSIESYNLIIYVSGLSSDIVNDDIEFIFTNINIKISSINRKNENYAIITLQQSSDTTLAIQKLNGSNQSDWIYNHNTAIQQQQQQQTMNKKKAYDNGNIITIRAANNDNNKVITRNTTVKITWFEPSCVAWIHFNSITTAKKAAYKLNGIVFKDRMIETKFQNPGIRQNSSFSVWIGNLVCSVTKSELYQMLTDKNFLPTSISINCSNTYIPIKSVKSIIKRTLEIYGPLDLFEECSSNSISSSSVGVTCNKTTLPKKKMIARFIRSDDCNEAVLKLNSKTIVELGNTKLFIERLFSAKFNIDNDIYTIIESEIKLLADDNYVKDIRLKVYKGSIITILKFTSNEPKILSAIKNKMHILIAGEIVVDLINNSLKSLKKQRPIWHDSLTQNVIDYNLQDISTRHHVLIKCDKRRKLIIVYSSNSKSKSNHMKVMTEIIEYIHQLKSMSQAIPVPIHIWKPLILQGLDNCKKYSQAINISLSVKNKCLLVQGDQFVIEKVMNYMKSLSNTSHTVNTSNIDIKDKTTDEVICPICLCVPEDSNEITSRLIKLSCGHCYCNECFQSFIQQTINGDNSYGHHFPIICCADQCKQAIKLHDLRTYIDENTFIHMLYASVDEYILKNQEKFQFCITPNCQGIFEIGTNENRVVYCTECKIFICSQCKIEEHEGLTCKEHQQQQGPANIIRNKILEDILTYKCPRCCKAFLDFDGCFAIKCSNCPCNFCGWCLKDCNEDAHPHVRSCEIKPKNADSYFGTKEQFIDVQNKRIIKELQLFFNNSIDNNKKKEILDSIANDLKDINININSIKI